VDQAIHSIRRALGDDARAPRFVRTLARRGVQFVGASADPPPARAGAFVGRRALLDALLERLGAAERRAGGVVLITGPAGIGKTRTASEVLSWARERGLGTATAWQADGSVSAAAPWRSLVLSLGSDAREIDRAAESGALFPALRSALEAACARAPLVALVDDLHEADVASVEFLDYLAGHPRPLALLAIATSRPASEFASAAAARALDRMRSRAGVAQLALGPLSAAEVAELITAETGRAPAPERAEALAGRLQGNPFWILQLLRSRAASALGSAAEAEWERLAERGMREVLGERLAQLGAADVRALEAAAVLGEEIDASLVASTCGTSAEQGRSVLAAGARAGLVVSATDGRSARFAHPLLRDALLACVSAERLATLHAAAARALAAWPSLRADGDAAVALHLLHAGRAGDPPRAVALGLAAGSRALREGAGDRAEGLLALASELLDEASAPAEQRAAVWVALARARGRTRVADRSGAAERALEWARRASLPAAFAEAALAFTGAMDRLRLPNPELVAVLEEALARVGLEHPGLRARLLGRLEAELSYAPRESRARLRAEALAEARRSGDAGVEAELLDLPFGGFWEALAPAEREESIARIAAYAASAGRRDLALAARLLHCTELAARGELAGQGLELEAAEREARELGDVAARYRAQLLAATRALALGETDRSDELAARAQALADRHGFPGETMARAQRLMVVIARGRARDALPALELARRVDAGPGIAAMLAHALAAAGERERCAQLLRDVARGPFADLARYPSAVANAHVIACAAAQVAATELVPLVEPILRPERGRVTIRGLMTSHGPAAVALACCAQLRGAPREAAELLAEGERLAEREGARGWLSEIRALRDKLHAPGAAAAGS
jgi:hypothetical protein